MLTVLDLCSGIGGFSLGLERAGGFRTAAFCEFNQFCREVLQSHWPEVPQFHDIRKLKGWHVGYVDVITAGFPCQPHSLAGKQEGPADPRDLWPDVCRLVREIMPEWFIGENVPGLDGKHMALDRVLVDLETAGYSAIPIEIPACAVDAPHIRKRLFIVANRPRERGDRRGHLGPQGRSKPANGGSHVANRERIGCSGQPAAAGRHDDDRQAAGRQQGADGAQHGGAGSHVANRASQRPQERQKPLAAQSQFPPAHRGRHMGDGALPGLAGGHLSNMSQHRQAHLDAQWTGAEWLECPDGKARRVKPGVRLLAHGVPRRVDQIRAYGNAVVPQIAEEIGRAIHASRL